MWWQCSTGCPPSTASSISRSAATNESSSTTSTRAHGPNGRTSLGFKVAYSGLVRWAMSALSKGSALNTHNEQKVPKTETGVRTSSPTMAHPGGRCCPALANICEPSRLDSVASAWAAAAWLATECRSGHRGHTAVCGLPYATPTHLRSTSARSFFAISSSVSLTTQTRWGLVPHGGSPRFGRAESSTNAGARRVGVAAAPDAPAAPPPVLPPVLPAESAADEDSGGVPVGPRDSGDASMAAGSTTVAHDRRAIYC